MSLIFQSLRVSYYCLCQMCALVHDLFFTFFFLILTETSYTPSLARTRTTLHNTPQSGFIGNMSHIFTCNDAVSCSSFESGRRWRTWYAWYVILKLCKETLAFKDDDHQQDEKERKFILLSSPEKLEVKPSPDRKVIRLVTLDNLLPSLQQLLKHVVE